MGGVLEFNHDVVTGGSQSGAGVIGTSRQGNPSQGQPRLH